MKKTLIFALVTTLFCFSAFAETKRKIQKANQDEQVEQALQLTQEMLKDPEQRKQIIQKSSRATEADKKAKEIAGSPENEQAIYALAASVFESMSARTNNDPEEMQKMLNEGLKNPESFAEQWSPEQLQQLHEIAGSAQNPKK